MGIERDDFSVSWQERIGEALVFLTGVSMIAAAMLLKSCEDQDLATTPAFTCTSVNHGHCMAYEVRK